MNPKEKDIFDMVYDFFRSLKLTIFLLILLAILSIIGTLIKQNAPSEEYIQRYGAQLYNVLEFFNIFDMYHSWWFTTILLLLVVNLIACTIQRFPGAWRQTYRESGAKELGDSMLKTLPYVERIKPSRSRGIGEDEFQTLVTKEFNSPKRIEGESSVTLYSEKGRFSRMGVYITHLSILFILIGGIIGSMFGFRGYVNILEGETVDQVALRVKDKQIARPIDFSVRCDDFRLVFYDLKGPQKMVQKYISDLSVLENGKEVLKKTIEVNDPLTYKGLTFYQSSYGAIHDLALGVRFRGQQEKRLFKISEGETVPIPNTPAHFQFIKYEHQLHNYGEGAQVALFKPNQQPRVFWLLKNVPQFDEQRGDEFVFTIEQVIEKEYTGLQVTKDPGVWVVWVGCSLMIIGLIVSFFFSHERVWVRIPTKGGGEIVLAGTTSKNKVGFEKKFGQFVEKVRSKSS
jgi:cytochrome c biogenesis protein